MATHFQISPDGAFLYHHSLSTYKEIIHGFALRRNPATGLEVSYGLNGYQPDSQVLENRQNLMVSFLSLNATDRGKEARLVTLNQIHSDEIVVAEDLAFTAQPAVGDGLLTGRPGLLLAVQTADCMPILILDPTSSAVAAVHAGWRGTLKRIVEKAIRRMQSRFGSDPEQCIAVVGPSIRNCCYSVGAEVLLAFQREFSYALSLFTPFSEAVSDPQKPLSEKRWFLDLPSACKRQLLDCGLKEARILADPPCTACNTQRFFSHRAEAGRCGRMMTAIGVLPTF